MSDVIANGVGMAYSLGGEGYGKLTETFYTALGLYNPDDHIPDVAVALVFEQ